MSCYICIVNEMKRRVVIDLLIVDQPRAAIYVLRFQLESGAAPMRGELNIFFLFFFALVLSSRENRQ